MPVTVLGVHSYAVGTRRKARPRGRERHAASGPAGGVSLFMGIDLPYRITALESEAVKPLPTLLPECAADLRGFAAA